MSLGVYWGQCIRILTPFTVFFLIEGLFYLLGYNQAYITYITAPLRLLVLNSLHCYVTLVVLKKKIDDLIDANNKFTICLKLLVILFLTVSLLYKDNYLSDSSFQNIFILLANVIFVPIILSNIAIDEKWYSFIWNSIRILFHSWDVFLKWFSYSIIIYWIGYIADYTRSRIGFDIITPILYPFGAIVTTVFIVRVQRIEGYKYLNFLRKK